MAKKKKAALKPIANRGFATTSTPSKRPDANGDDAAAFAKGSDVVKGGLNGSGDDKNDVEASADRIFSETEAPSGQAREANDITKEEPQYNAEEEEEQAIQNIVDRLSERVGKDVARFWKTIEFDRRFARQLPIFELDADVQDEILQSSKDENEEQGRDAKCTSHDISDILAELAPNSAASSFLQKALVSYALLCKLGYTTAQAHMALCATEDATDIDECVAWLTAKLTSEELLAAERRCDGRLPSSDEVDTAQLADDTVPPMHKGFTFERSAAATSQAPTRSGSPQQTLDSVNQKPAELSNETAVLIESAKSEALNMQSALDDRDTIDTLEDPINSYAHARLFLIKSEKQVTAIDRAIKALNGGAPAVVVDAKKRLLEIKSSARQVIDECQASPGWNAPAAESIFSHFKMNWEDEEQKKAKEQKARRDVELEDVQGSSAAEERATDTDDSLFGDLLDEQANEVQDVKTQGTVHLRDLPSHAVKAQGSRTPRALIADSLRRTHPSANARFDPMSTGGRMFRSRLTLRWMANGKSVVDTYTMTTMATLSQGSADDLMAIAALLCVDNRGIYKTLGVGWREWWDELVEQRKAERDAASRSHIRQMLSSLQSKLFAENAKAHEANQRSKAAMQAANKDTHTNEGGNAKDEDGETLQESVRQDTNGKSLWDARVQSEAYQRMLPARLNLPISTYKDHILGILAHNQAIVLSGETGCGKSTQVPSFILQDSLEQGKHCRVYVTEPRRISAISLAERVSQELGESRGSVGKPDSLVGSAVRLESNIGRNARLVYATTGIVLRMLEGSQLEGVTHVIVDEVHERSIESDFLLIILKSLMQSRNDLKVILMSATLDADRISAYFGGCPMINVPGRTFPVDVYWLEDAVELCDYTLEDGSPYARRLNRRTGWKEKKMNLASTEEDMPEESSDEDEEKQSKVTAGSTHYRPKTISTLERLDENAVNPDLIVALLEQLCFGSGRYQEYSAAILIFLPGLAEIRKLYDLLQAHREFGTSSFQIFALHSSIASEDQSLVFDFPPQGVRKIVISTNIAETGITIPDITCVIDSGKQREMRFDEKRQMSKLVDCFVARSNAKQRRGRAGRVQNGICWHLFTKYRHDNYLGEHQIPEMLRLSLQDLALKLKVMKVKIGNSIEDALSKALDAPSPTNIQRAIASLTEIKALTANEEITALGRQLSKLPLDVHMGKMLLVSCTFNMLDTALTVAATLNAKSPFLTPFGREAEARAAKQSFDAGNSDFVTSVRAFNAWRRATENGVGRQFCQRCFLSQTNLIQIEELRQQYMSYLLDANFVNVDNKARREIVSGRFRYQSAKTRFMSVPVQVNGNSSSIAMLHAALATSLYPKLLNVDVRNGSLRTLTNNAPTSMHPSSVNFKMRLDQLPKGIHHFVFYTIMQSRRLFAWETAAVDDRALLLLCGEADFKFSAQSLYLDRQRLRVTFYELKTLLALKILRQRLLRILQTSFRAPGRALSDSDTHTLILTSKFLGVGANEKDLAVV